MLIYLHGFGSSAAAEKPTLLAQRMKARGLANQFWCETLPYRPAQAIAFIESAIKNSRTTPTLVGNSLGGYYATYLAEKHNLNAAIINPAVAAHETLAKFIGPHRNSYTGENFEVTKEHIAELVEFDLRQITNPARFWLLVETGDELLDYRLAIQRYAGAQQTVIEGGNHSFQSFADYMNPIIDFALGKNTR